MFNALEGKEHRCEYVGLEAVDVPDGRYSFCAERMGEIAGNDRTRSLLPLCHYFPCVRIRGNRLV